MTTPAPCWADPLTRDERRKVAEFLSRACGRFYRAALEANAGETARYARLSSSMDMSTLHLDVTERAQLPPDHPVAVQARNRFADLSELAADENWLGI